MSLFSVFILGISCVSFSGNPPAPTVLIYMPRFGFGFCLLSLTERRGICKECRSALHQLWLSYFSVSFCFPFSLSLFSVCAKSLNLSLVKSLHVHVCVHVFVLLLPSPTSSCLHVMELNTFNFTFAFSLASLSFFQSLFKCITFFNFRLYFLFNFSYSGRLFMWQLKSSYLTVY